MLHLHSVKEHCGPSQPPYSLYATALTCTLSRTLKESGLTGATAAAVASALSTEHAPDSLARTQVVFDGHM
jgi:hypothetical protein